MDKTYYIFLDYDGVMWDWKYIKQLISENKFDKGNIIDILKPESAHAINYLIHELKNLNFIPKIIISSSVRLTDFTYNHFINSLKNNLDYDQSFDRTDNNNVRGKSILNYLIDKTNYDYVVIDDEISDLIGYIPLNKIIHTNMQDNALSVNHIKQYINHISSNNNNFTN